MRFVLICIALALCSACDRNRNQTVVAAPAQNSRPVEPAPVPKPPEAPVPQKYDTLPITNLNPNLADSCLSSNVIPTGDCAIGLLDSLDSPSDGGPQIDWIGKIQWIDFKDTEDTKSNPSANGLFNTSHGGFSVYAIRGNMCLVWGTKQHWGWIKFDKSMMKYYDITSPDWKIIDSHSYDNVHVEANDIAGPLRETPSDHGRIIANLENKAWKQTAKQKGELKLAEGASDHGTWVHILEQQGDWVRVHLPKSERFYPLRNEGAFGVEVKWDLNLEGWIRWRKPGPVKGTNQILLGVREIGFYD